VVLLILTQSGFNESKDIIVRGDAAAWINGNILSKDELQILRKKGVEITKFSYVIDPKDQEVIEGALVTIKEHHPGETIWVEKALNF
jgi:hypothetical protein